MDDIDLILAGMQRELEEQERKIRALGERLAAGENGVRAELNPAIRSAGLLRSDIFELKREYQRFTPSEQVLQAGCCCEATPHEKLSREQVLASQKEVAQIMMGIMPQLSALTDDAVELLAFAWNDPKGSIESLADMCGSTPADGREIAEASARWSAVRWRAAVRLLEDLDLTEPLQGRVECFELTWWGYRVAGLIHYGAQPPKP